MNHSEPITRVSAHKNNNPMNAQVLQKFTMDEKISCEWCIDNKNQYSNEIFNMKRKNKTKELEDSINNYTEFTAVCKQVDVYFREKYKSCLSDKTISAKLRIENILYLWKCQSISNIVCPLKKPSYLTS